MLNRQPQLVTRFSTLAFFVFCAGALAASSQVRAQETSDEPESAFDGIIEELVVTARKREENLQDTPIAISAYTGDGLDSRGLTSVADIGDLTPNMTYTNNPEVGGSTSVSTVYIRGIGQRDFLGTIDNGVGFYIDDVYIARTVGAVVDLLDIDRVEVLRGPQGTLFGRNSVGGALKLHSKKPEDAFGGYVDFMLGTDSQTLLRSTLNIPLSDQALSSVSLLSSQQGGYVEQPNGAGDLGNEDNTAFRAQLLLHPTDTLEISLAVDSSSEDEKGAPFVLVYAGTTVDRGFAGFHNNNRVPDSACAYPGGITSTNPLCYNEQWVGDINQGTGPTYSTTDTEGIRMSIEWDFSDTISFKSITAQRDLDAEFARDADASPVQVTHFYDSFTSQQFSQEFQLVGSSFDNKLDWIGGLYFFDEKGKNVNLLNFAIANFMSGAGFGNSNTAVYLQGTWHATDRVHLTGGLRYTDETKTYDPVQTAGVNYLDLPVGTPLVPLGKNETDAQETTPLLNVAYDLSETAMLYGTYSEGFRSGGFVQRIFPPLKIVPSFGPEYVENYELGFKYQPAAGNLRLNAAAYVSDYTDIQVRTENPGFVGQFEANVGDAEISGYEVELAWQFHKSWVLEAALGITNAAYTAIRVEPPLKAAVNLDSEFDHVPENTSSLSVARDFQLAGGSSLLLRFSSTSHSGWFNNPFNTLNVVTPATDLYNLTGTWTFADRRLELKGGIKNLDDNKYLASGYENPSIGFAEAIFDRGREWYLGARYHF